MNGVLDHNQMPKTKKRAMHESFGFKSEVNELSNYIEEIKEMEKYNNQSWNAVKMEDQIEKMRTKLGFIKNTANVDKKLYQLVGEFHQ